MRRGRFVVAAGFLVLRAGAAQAQSLTLAEAIAEGLRAEPALKAARLEVDVARGDRAQSTLRPNPMMAFEQREQMGGSDRQSAVMFELPLDLFRRDSRIDAAGRGVERAEAEVRDRERLLAGGIRDAYGTAAADARRLEVMEEVAGAARRTHELLANRVAEGAAPALERDLALVDRRRVEGARELAAGRAASSIARLKVLLGRPPSSDLKLTETIEQLASAGAGRGDASPPERGDVASAAADAALARAELVTAQQESKPEVGIFASYMRMDAMFPQLGLSPSGVFEPVHDVFHNAGIGVRISLPIFNRGQGAVAAAKAREAAALETLAARRLGAEGDLDAASARSGAARRALAVFSGETRDLARRNLDVVRETYALGRATLFDVLNEQRRYLEFEAAFIDALAEAFAASTELLRAKGERQ